MNNFKNYKFKENIIIKNRFVLAPMTTYSGNPDLTLSDEEEKYYQARGKEFGMVITAATAVSKQAQAFENQISIMNDDYIPSMARLAKSIKLGGALAILQLHHGGRMNYPGLFEGQDIVSASAIKAERDYLLEPRALTNDEVYGIIDDFRQAMIRAIKAGFDGIELHGANTYLIQQFFSPHSNRRTDEFGGSLEKRMTFPLALVDMVIQTRKDYANDDFIIGYRLSPEEYENPGINLDDTKVLVRNLSMKNIDYIHFSLGNYKQSSIRDEINKKPIIEILKKENLGHKKLIGVGEIDNLDKANHAINLGFDLLAIGLQALADENVVSHIINNHSVKKVFDKNSILPSNLYERVKRWRNLSDRGFSFDQ
ncbi:MAG: NADH-dependent flavin oxidoreductase [Candidatus Izemoplasmatales bacterium]